MLLDQYYEAAAAVSPAMLPPTEEQEEGGWSPDATAAGHLPIADIADRLDSPPQPNFTAAAVGVQQQQQYATAYSMPRSQNRLAPLATSAEEANPLRRRVESCLLQRERTVQGFTSWLNTTYLVQEKVGAKYGIGTSGGGGGSNPADLRTWRTVSSSTRDGHRIKAALYIAALRQHSMELVEALEEWRASRAPLQIVTGSGRQLDLPRPFVWRGRWWPLQLCLDPPLLPLPLASDPLLMRWFHEADEGDASLWHQEPQAGSSHSPSPMIRGLPRRPGMPPSKPTPSATPPAIFTPQAWHPPSVVARMEAADAVLASEVEMLELRVSDLLRSRVANSGGNTSGGASGASGFGSKASGWLTDGASLQLCRILYGDPKTYATALKVKCRQIDQAMYEEYARRDAAAIRLQSAARGRKERLTGRFALTKPKTARKEPIGRFELRKEAAGRYGGVNVTVDTKNLKMGETLQDRLRDALTQNFTRVMELFRDWDVDGNGTINKKEFRKAMNAIGVKVAVKELDALFDSFDLDGGGLLEAKELGKVLRRGAGKEIQLKGELQAGAKGKIEVKAKNKRALRKSAKEGTSRRAGIEPTIENIRKAMEEDYLRTKDIVNYLDADQGGDVSKEEFTRGLCMVFGFDPEKSEAINTLFDTFDADQSGQIDFDELHTLLRSTLSSDEMVEHKAATKIAAMQRGKKTRRELTAIKLPPRKASVIGVGGTHLTNRISISHSGVPISRTSISRG